MTPLSSFTAITELSDGTEARAIYFNERFSGLSQNLDELNADASNFSSDFSDVRSVLVSTEAFAGADIGARFNNAVSSISLTGGIVVIPPGVYTATTEPVINSGLTHITVFAEGSEIRTSGTSSALKITGAGALGAVLVHAYRIGHRDNSDASYGINVEGSTNVRLYDPIVVTGNTAPGYVAIRFAQATDNDGTTGAFWGRLINPWIRKYTGADSDVSLGVVVEGQCNSFSLLGGGINNCDIALSIRSQSNSTLGNVPDKVSITDVAFESCTTGIQIFSNTVGVSLQGPLVTNCRVESVGTFLSIETITGTPTRPPLLFGNMLASNVSGYINNPNNVLIDSLDHVRNPDIGAMFLSRELRIRPFDTNTAALELHNVGPNRGLSITSGASGTARALQLLVGSNADDGRILSNQSIEIIAGSNGNIVLKTGGTSGTTFFHSVAAASGEVHSGFGTDVPTEQLHVSGSTIRLETPLTPASGTAAGNAGDIMWDSGFVYICTSDASWTRTALSTF